jgi:hypothetical protein
VKGVVTVLIRAHLVYRLIYNDDVAAGQLAVFQGAAALLVGYVSSSDMRPPTASPARTALPAAHFERNDVTGIYETVH